MSVSSHPRVVKVVLLGLGNVGRALVDLVVSSRPYHASRYGLRFDFVALCDSTGYVYSNPLTDSQLHALLSHKQARQPLHSFQPGGSASTSALAVAEAHVDRSTIVVDCAATPSTIDALLLTVNRGGAITLANKQPLCTRYAQFETLMSPLHRPRVRYESTVGAGTPFVAALHRLLASNDSPKQIQGTFSGTLGFLCSGLEQGRSYSDVVNEAYKLGYTEPDPRDDLGGVDVARKALILARTIGWQLEMSDIDIHPLYPSSLASLPIPDFLSSLHTLNSHYAHLHSQALSSHSTLRYVATLSDRSIRVGLEPLSQSSAIGRLQGTENMVEYRTAVYEKGLVIQGSGAGGQVTASGVMADMVELAWVLGKE